MISKSVRSYLVTNLHKQGLSPAKMVTQIQVFNFSWWVTIKTNFIPVPIAKNKTKSLSESKRLQGSARFLSGI